MSCSYKNCPNPDVLDMQSSSLSTCAGCKGINYCSDECSKLDWEVSHKFTCPNESASVNLSTISGCSTPTSKSRFRKSLNDYDFVNVPKRPSPDLGHGSYGVVKLVKEKNGDPNKFFAMKIMNKIKLKEFATVENLKREINIQKILSHPRIIRLYHYFEDKENVYLVMEYAEEGNLFRYLKNKKTLKEEEAFIYFYETCLGLEYLHKKNVIHRDLKPENLLLDKTGNIKLCDFGWSIADGGDRKTMCGTPEYMAPEIVQKKPYDYKVDIWAIGILLYEMLHGYAPFKARSYDETFDKIAKEDILYNPMISKEAIELIGTILQKDPKLRPDFDAIFSHPWLTKHEPRFNLNLQQMRYVSRNDNRRKSAVPLNQKTVQDAGSTVMDEENNSNNANNNNDKYRKSEITSHVRSYSTSPINLTQLVKNNMANAAKNQETTTKELQSFQFPNPASRSSNEVKNEAKKFYRSQGTVHIKSERRYCKHV
jgi:serine/threonine protein kinase